MPELHGDKPRIKRTYLSKVILSGRFAELRLVSRAALPVVWEHCDSGGWCFLGDARVSVEAGIGRTSVPTARRELQERGLIRCEFRLTKCPDGKVRKVMNYWLLDIPEDAVSTGRSQVNTEVRKLRQRERTKKSRQRRSSGSHNHDAPSDRVSPQASRPCPTNGSPPVPPTVGGEPDPAQNQDVHEPGSTGAGSAETVEDAGERRSPEMPADPKSYFKCSFCQDGLGWDCANPSHLRQELKTLGVRNPEAFLVQYGPLSLRQQLGALRFCQERAPKKIGKPPEYLYVAVRDRHELPSELKPTWDALRRERDEARREAEEQRRAQQREGLWQPLFADLASWSADLSPEQRHQIEGDVRHWFETDEGRRWLEGREGNLCRGSVEGDANLWEGQGRVAIIRFLQHARPGLAEAAGVSLTGSGSTPGLDGKKEKNHG